MQPFDLRELKTYSLHDRASKVSVEHLGRPVDPSVPFDDWLDSLPQQLAANQLRKLRDRILRAHAEGRTIAVAIGGHVIKTGCAPYLIDWIRKGVISSVSMNGSAAIHDFELALAGRTSEDVAKQLPEGRFGMAHETADAFAIASRNGSEVGLGRALGEHIAAIKAPFSEFSLVHAAARASVPCTIHVALGTDIVHMHPQVSGAALGEASLVDFRLLCSVVATMKAGIWMNIGSAVVMPEVFLKAVSVVRNFGHDLEGLLTVNFDMQAKYRTTMNVLGRPGDEGIEIIGHHEILIPLLHRAIASGLVSTSNGREAA